MRPAVTRPEPPITGNECAMETVWLDSQQTTLPRKGQRLDGAALTFPGVASLPRNRIEEDARHDGDASLPREQIKRFVGE